MYKFVPIGHKGELLNADMISRIIPQDEGSIVVTKDGQYLESEYQLDDNLFQFFNIQSIAPVTGVDAIYMDESGNTTTKPCIALLLMMDGSIEPLTLEDDEDLTRHAAHGITGHVGFVASK